jgi:hypothetical protein
MDYVNHAQNVLVRTSVQGRDRIRYAVPIPRGPRSEQSGWQPSWQVFVDHGHIPIPLATALATEPEPGNRSVTVSVSAS